MRPKTGRQLSSLSHKQYFSLFSSSDFLLILVEDAPFALMTSEYLREKSMVQIVLHGCAHKYISNAMISMLVVSESRELKHREDLLGRELPPVKLSPCTSPTPLQIAKLRMIPETGLHPWRPLQHTFCNEIACFFPKNETLYLELDQRNRDGEDYAVEAPWGSLHRMWYPVDVESFADYAVMWFPEEWSEPDSYREQHREEPEDRFLQYFYDPLQYRCTHVDTWGGEEKVCVCVCVCVCACLCDCLSYTNKHEPMPM